MIKKNVCTRQMFSPFFVLESGERRAEGKDQKKSKKKKFFSVGG